MIPNAGRDLEPQERSYIAGRDAKWYSHFQRQVASFLKSKHTFALLGVYPNELKTDVNTKNLHTDFFFIEALFILAKAFKPSRCPLVDEWINKLYHMQTMEYYSVIKRKELSSHEKTWRKLKCISLSERSQSVKAAYCVITTIWHSGKGKTMETVKRLVVSRALGKEEFIGRAQRICDGWGVVSETILHHATLVDICRYTFVQIQRTYNKSEPQCKPWTWGDNNVSM